MDLWTKFEEDRPRQTDGHPTDICNAKWPLFFEWGHKYIDGRMED